HRAPRGSPAIVAGNETESRLELFLRSDPGIRDGLLIFAVVRDGKLKCARRPEPADLEGLLFQNSDARYGISVEITLRSQASHRVSPTILGAHGGVLGSGAKTVSTHRLGGAGGKVNEERQLFTRRDDNGSLD